MHLLSRRRDLKTQVVECRSTVTLDGKSVELMPMAYALTYTGSGAGRLAR